MRCALIAFICFIIGGLLSTCLTYQFGRCKTNEIIFRLPPAKDQQSGGAILSQS